MHFFIKISNHLLKHYIHIIKVRSSLKTIINKYILKLFQILKYISISNTAPLGSIPELPAESCREIKASEGKNTISGKYWVDPTGTGNKRLVYCDMELEGYSRLVCLSNLIFYFF